MPLALFAFKSWRWGNRQGVFRLSIGFRVVSRAPVDVAITSNTAWSVDVLLEGPMKHLGRCAMRTFYVGGWDGKFLTTSEGTARNTPRKRA